MARIVSALIALVLTAGVASAQGIDGRLNAINKTKIIKIAYRTDAAPFSYVNENKEPTGYTVDLCKLVVRLLEKQLGVQEFDIQWVPVTTQTRFEAVANGTADMECGSSTATLSRMKQVDFSSFVFIESTGLVVKRTLISVVSMIWRVKKLLSSPVPAMNAPCPKRTSSRI